MEISTCNKTCRECAFNGSAKDSLYAETYNIIKKGIIFPCHMYLKSKSGDMSYGTEDLEEVKVCRGYVAFMKKYHDDIAIKQPHWAYLFQDIDDSELKDIISMKKLLENHKHLREGIYLGN